MAIHTLLSPFPGTFYRSASPGEPAFKNEGDVVQEGDVVGLIEVMKQFSEVTADAGGKLVKFHVENEAPIDTGDALADIETHD